jgi:hypothetical protein
MKKVALNLFFFGNLLLQILLRSIMWTNQKEWLRLFNFSL